jgi:hypothetical protein
LRKIIKSRTTGYISAETLTETTSKAARKNWMELMEPKVRFFVHMYPEPVVSNPRPHVMDELDLRTACFYKFVTMVY